MVNHVIDGKNLIPAVAFLGMVWETLAMLHGETYTNLSVVFEDINFKRATLLPKEDEIQLTVMVQKGMLIVLIHIKFNMRAICFIYRMIVIIFYY